MKVIETMEFPQGLQVKLLVKKELAERLQVSQRTVENWMRLGIIPYLQIRNVVRFDESAVVAALNRHVRRGRK